MISISTFIAFNLKCVTVPNLISLKKTVITVKLKSIYSFSKFVN